MLLSTLAFAVMNVFLKMVSHLPSMEIVLFRCLVSLIICLYMIKQANEDWRGSNRKLLTRPRYFRHSCTIYILQNAGRNAAGYCRYHTIPVTNFHHYYRGFFPTGDE
jgi:drug/metabolite transporter (DMT)-like permease